LGPDTLTCYLVYLIRSEIPLGESQANAPSTSACGMGLPENVTVVDFKFLDESLLVLCHQRGLSISDLEKVGGLPN